MPSDINVVEEGTVHEPALLSAIDIFKIMCRFSWPTALSYTFSFQMVLITILYRQLRHDENHQDAAALIATYINCIATVSFSPLFAGSLRAGYLIGQLKQITINQRDEDGDELVILQEKITETFRSSLVLGQAVLSPLAASFLVFSKNILTDVFQQNPEISSIVQKFTSFYAISMPALMLRMSAEQEMFAQGKTIPPMVIALCNFFISMSLGSMFAKGWFGVPKYGDEALLIACIVDSFLTALGFTLYIAYQKDFKKFEFLNLKKPFTHFKEIFLSITKLGVSFPLPFLIEFGTNFGTTIIASHQGITAQSRIGSIMQYGLPIQLLSSAFGQCTAQELSRRLGENDFKNAYRIGTYGIAVALVNIAPIAIFFAALPNFLEGKANVDDVSPTTKWVAAIMSLGFILDIIRFNMLQQLRVFGEPNIAALISCIALVIGMTLSFILTTQTELGIIGDALGYAFGNFIANLVLGRRWWPKVRTLASREETVYTDKASFGFFPQTSNPEQTLLSASEAGRSSTLNYLSMD